MTLTSRSALSLPSAPVPNVLVVLLLAAGLAACQSSGDGSAGGEAEETGAPPVVEVTMMDYAFQAPDSIRSGWMTFQVANKGKEHHHYHLHPLPDGRTAEDFLTAVIAPLDSLTQLRRAGTIDSEEWQKAYERVVPDWGKLQNLKNRGGIGLLAPGRTARNTVKLEPGTYLLHCLIRAPDGRIHAALGMRYFLTVTEEKTGAAPPTPDIAARIFGRELQFPDTLSAGTHTFAFEVEEVAPGMDSSYYAWIARLGPDVSVDSLVQWDVQNPPPTEFLGGFEYTEVGRTPYMTVDLSPGRYLWHWDYHGADLPYMHKEFVVE